MVVGCESCDYARNVCIAITFRVGWWPVVYPFRIAQVRARGTTARITRLLASKRLHILWPLRAPVKPWRADAEWAGAVTISVKSRKGTSCRVLAILSSKRCSLSLAFHQKHHTPSCTSIDCDAGAHDYTYHVHPIAVQLACAVTGAVSTTTYRPEDIVQIWHKLVQSSCAPG